MPRTRAIYSGRMEPLTPHLPGVEGGQIRRLRREEYDSLVARGAFERERVELIRGVIVRMPPQGPPHMGPVQRLTHLLVVALNGRAHVRVQAPLIAPDDSEPEPDLAVVPVGDYDDAHPSEAFLVIEVAHSSLAYDRGTKGPLYAQMNVEEYWIVDVKGERIEVHRAPAGDHYESVATHRKGDAISLARFSDVAIEVSAILK
jgi:Uma2 family endonuclease